MGAVIENDAEPLLVMEYMDLGKYRGNQTLVKLLLTYASFVDPRQSTRHIAK